MLKDIARDFAGLNKAGVEITESLALKFKRKERERILELYRKNSGKEFAKQLKEMIAV